MAKSELANITIKDAKLLRKNFGGRPWNDRNAPLSAEPSGRGDFLVALEEDIGKTLKDLGWNVKYLAPREDYGDDSGMYTLPVAFDFGYYKPPVIFIVTDEGARIKQNPSTIRHLDNMSVKSIDIELRASHWTNSFGNSGEKAYVEKMAIKLEPITDFDRMYDPSSIDNDDMF